MFKRLTIICLVLGLVFIPMTGVGGTGTNFPVKFRTGIRINHQINGHQLWPEIAVDNEGYINLVWWEHGDNHDDIYFTRSEDDGITWRQEIKINSWPPSARDYPGAWPDIAVDKRGNIFVVWVSRVNGQGPDNLYFTKSTNGGLTWTKPKEINDTPGVVKVCQPSITVYGRTIFATWTDLREDGTYSDVYFSKSKDGGLNWTQNVRVNDNLGYLPVAGEPDVVANKYGIFVTWNDWRGDVPGGRFPDVYFAKSTDGGLTWTNPNIRVNHNTLWFQEDPRIAVNGQEVYIVFIDCDFITKEIWFAKSSSDATDEWINKKIDDSPGPNGVYIPDIVSKDDKIFVIWGIDSRTGKQQIGFTMSFDKGEKWSANQLIPVALKPTAQNGPAIDVFNDDIYVAWHFYQSFQTYDVYFSKGKLIKEITDYR